MSNPGLNPEGFQILTIPQIVDDTSQQLQLEFGQSILKPKTFLTFMVGVVGNSAGLVWEALESLYDAFNPDKASGFLLEDLSLLTGTFKNFAKPSMANVIFCGDDGFVVDANTLAMTESTEKRFASTTPVAIALLDAWTITTAYAEGDRVTNASRCYQCITAGVSDGSGGPTTTADDITDGSAHWIYIGEGDSAVDAVMLSIDLGPIVAVAGDLNQIVTPVGGLNSVRNIEDAKLGNIDETDEELRLRRNAELKGAARTPADAIRTAVSRLDGVVGVTVFQNLTNVTNGDGMPPHSVEVLVQDGDDQDIWDALWANVAAGIVTYGTENGTTLDSQGVTQDRAFSRPTEKNIHVDITLIKDPNFYPVNGDDAVAADIVAFGELGGSGKDAVPSSLGAQAFNVDGVIEVTQILLYTDAIGAPAAWIASHAYVATVGSRSVVTNDGGRVYICITSGNSAGSGGPTGVGQDITDGTAHWAFIGATIAIGTRELAKYALANVNVHSSDGEP